MFLFFIFTGSIQKPSVICEKLLFSAGIIKTESFNSKLLNPSNQLPSSSVNALSKGNVSDFPIILNSKFS